MTAGGHHQTTLGRRCASLLGALALAAVAAACSDSPADDAQSDASRPAPTATTATTESPPPAGTVIAVDGGEIHQTIDGFGASIRLFDDPHLTETFDQRTRRSRIVVPPDEQAAILDALYRDLGLTRMRPATGNNMQEVPGGPIDFSWKLNDGYVDFARTAQERGVDTVFLSPIKLEPWVSERDPAPAVDLAFRTIMRWNELGVPLAYYSVVNEPGNEASGGWSGEFIRDFIKLLGPRLRAAGLDTRFVVPDDVNPAQALSRIRVVLADAEARQYVGALAYHLYGRQGQDEMDAVTDLARRHGLPVWMTEFYESDAFDWGSLVQQLLVEHDVAAVDYLWGFFGQWQSKAEQLIVIRHRAGRYSGFERTKNFFVFGQFSRFVRPGAQRIGATVTREGLSVSAFADGDATVIVAINRAESAVPVRVEIDQRPTGDVEGVRTTRTADWEDIEPATVRDGAFSTTLLPESVTTFTVS